MLIPFCCQKSRTYKKMSVMAKREKEHLDKTLNTFEDINKKLHIAKK